MVPMVVRVLKQALLPFVRLLTTVCIRLVPRLNCPWQTALTRPAKVAITLDGLFLLLLGNTGPRTTSTVQLCTRECPFVV